VTGNSAIARVIILNPSLRPKTQLQPDMTDFSSDSDMIRIVGTATPWSDRAGIPSREKFCSTAIMAAKAPPNGVASRESAEASSLPPVIRINFGNSYASVAVFTKVCARPCLFPSRRSPKPDGTAWRSALLTRMANGRSHPPSHFIGERRHCRHQVGADHCAVHWESSQTSTDKKNSSNTILGFRDLLGKRCMICIRSLLDTHTPSHWQVFRDRFRTAKTTRFSSCDPASRNCG
jgi:hypothetical protein